MLRQTKPGWNIRNNKQQYVTNTIKLWYNEWGKLRTILHEQLQPETQHKTPQQTKREIQKTLRGYPYGETKKLKELKQIIDCYRIREHQQTIDILELDAKEHDTISQIMLKYPAKPIETQKQTTHEIQCESCQNRPATYRGSEIHQKRSATCQIQMRPRKNFQILCSVTTSINYSLTITT